MKALAASLLVVTAGGLAALPGAAAEYKWIDQNGNVVYGDHPPDESAVALRRPGGLTVTQTVKAPVDPTLQFPLALREAARANPVALYVANDCQPCQMAAQHLRLRGIPFQEWKVTSNADFERFKALGFSGNGFPPSAWAASAAWATRPMPGTGCWIAHAIRPNRCCPPPTSTRRPPTCRPTFPCRAPRPSASPHGSSMPAKCCRPVASGGIRVARRVVLRVARRRRPTSASEHPPSGKIG